MTTAAVLNWRMPGQAAVEPVPTTRAQAIARGLPRYFTGEPCHAGHTAERSTLDKTCIECRRARERRARAAVRLALKGP